MVMSKDPRRIAGTAVSFNFDLPRVSLSDARETRRGTGVIHSDYSNYQCWPPGVTVRVTESNDYPAGALIAVCTHDLGVL